MQEKGTISIHTENIFPIIKKFLYSDSEIFLRELVSNAVDATQKLQRLSSLGEFKEELGDLSIRVNVDKDKKTLSIKDRGIGMTAEEIKKYINQIAFSGATEFIEKFKDKGDTQIIGMFGLGFYSAFMVAHKVEIITQSYQEGAEAAKWTCEGSTDFEIEPTVKNDRGSEIILHLNDDASEFLEDHRISEILNKYCKFLPVPIVFGENEEPVKDEKGEPVKDDEGNEKKVKKDNVINDSTPIWTKSPSDLTDEDYKKFYQDLYPFSEEPLFWIHLNVDYPFNLTGVLYFPKVKKDIDVNRNKIQLYSKQVFITDEVKDVVPEFLMLLHGVIDSPDIPLNVSRSYLQSDSNVKKINNYITKKVAEKLGDIFKKDRPSYESKWDSVGLFVKYGMISEDKFYEKAKDFALYQSALDDKFYTLEEYKEKVKDNQTDKDGNVVMLYTTDEGKQDAYIASAKNKSYDVVRMDGAIDNHFVNNIEQKLEKVSLKRVDADTIDKLIDKDEKHESVLTEEQQTKVKEVFENTIGDQKYTVQTSSMSPDDMPVVITMPEFMRRMKDMAAMGGMGMMGSMPDNFNVTINTNHPLVSKIAETEDGTKKKDLAKQSFDLALLSQGMLSGSDLTSFIKRSVDMID